MHTIPGGPIKFGGPMKLGGPIGPQLGSNGGGPRNLGPAGPGGQFGLGGASKGNPLFAPRNMGPRGPNPLPLNLGEPPLIGKSNPPLPRPLKLFLNVVTRYLIVLPCHLEEGRPEASFRILLDSYEKQKDTLCSTLCGSDLFGTAHIRAVTLLEDTNVACKEIISINKNPREDARGVQRRSKDKKKIRHFARVSHLSGLR